MKNDDFTGVDRALTPLMEQRLAAMQPLPDIEQRIATMLTRSLEPAAAWVSAGAVNVRLLAVFGAVVILMVATMGLQGWERMQWWQAAAMTVFLGVGAVLASMNVSSRVIPASRRVIPPGLGSVLAAVAVLTVASIFSWEMSEAFVTEGTSCLLRGVAIGAGAACMFWIVIRRGAFLARTALGAGIGLVSGLAGVAVLQFRCPLQNATHLLTWHAGALVAAVTIGYAAGWVGERIRVTHGPVAAKK